MNIAINAIDTLRNATENGCRFMSFLYKSKGTGEVSRYQINFGIDYKSACEHDKLMLMTHNPENDIEREALTEMVQSLHETITEGVSSSYTQKDTFVSVGKGIRQHKETGELYIYGFVESKEQVEPPTTPKKEVNSSAKTLAKRKIEKDLKLKRNKFAQFKLSLEHIGGIKVCGEVVELHP